jgi:hypothetical protein
MVKITDIKRDTQMEIVDRFNTINGQDFYPVRYKKSKKPKTNYISSIILLSVKLGRITSLAFLSSGK